MLVVRRRVGERILVGSEVEIVITEIGPRSVKIGVVAPRGVQVLRGEVHDAIARANAAAADVSAKIPAPEFTPSLLQEVR